MIASRQWHFVASMPVVSKRMEVSAMQHAVTQVAPCADQLDHGRVLGGQRMGYTAPERARGHHAAPSMDMWAFGVIAQELLLGECTRSFDVSKWGELGIALNNCRAQDPGDRPSADRLRELLDVRLHNQRAPLHLMDLSAFGNGDDWPQSTTISQSTSAHFSGGTCSHVPAVAHSNVSARMSTVSG
jgi:serine/threonine protein kinase